MDDPENPEDDFRQQCPDEKRTMIYSLVEVRIVARVKHDEDADLQDVMSQANYTLEYDDVDAKIINTEMREVNELGECDEHGTLIVESIEEPHDLQDFDFT